MALRRSRSITFIDGVTQVPADLMNELQDDNIADEDRIRGFAFGFRDDFIASAADSNVWTNAPSNVDDSANGGFGTVRLNVALATSDTMDTVSLFPLAGLDFRLAIRVRIADKSGSGGYFFFGFKDGSDVFGFEAQDTDANWLTILTTILSQELTSIPVSTTDYANLEIERIGSTVTMYINGTSVRTISSPSDYDPQLVGIIYDNGVDAYLDLVALSVDR
jgi:hypothetical protein